MHTTSTTESHLVRMFMSQHVPHCIGFCPGACNIIPCLPYSTVSILAWKEPNVHWAGTVLTPVYTTQCIQGVTTSQILIVTSSSFLSATTDLSQVLLEDAQKRASPPATPIIHMPIFVIFCNRTVSDKRQKSHKTIWFACVHISLQQSTDYTGPVWHIHGIG